MRIDGPSSARMAGEFDWRIIQRLETLPYCSNLGVPDVP